MSPADIRRLHACGGILPCAMLTAHCVVNDRRHVAHAGRFHDFSFDESTQGADAIETWVCDDLLWDPATFEHDLAAITLARPTTLDPGS